MKKINWNKVYEYGWLLSFVASTTIYCSLMGVFISLAYQDSFETALYFFVLFIVFPIGYTWMFMDSKMDKLKYEVRNLEHKLKIREIQNQLNELYYTTRIETIKSQTNTTHNENE